MLGGARTQSRFVALVVGSVLGVAGAVVSAIPAEAGGSPTLQVLPTSAAAGSSVNVSGSCNGTGQPQVRGFLVVGSSHPSQGFDGSITPDAALDGSFATTFPLPAETPAGIWRFELQCVFTDVARPGPPVDVSVSAVSPELMAFKADPDPAVAGQPLHLSGSGCAAQGRGLDRVVVSLFRIESDRATSHAVSVTTSPDAVGVWEVTLDVPADFPEGDAAVGVQCDDTRQEQPSWGRVLQTSFDVVAGSEPLRTTNPRTQNTLAHTGPGAAHALAALSLVLIALGLSALTIAARRNKAT